MPDEPVIKDGQRTRPHTCSPWARRRTRGTARPDTRPRSTPCPARPALRPAEGTRTQAGGGSGPTHGNATMPPRRRRSPRAGTPKAHTSKGTHLAAERSSHLRALHAQLERRIAIPAQHPRANSATTHRQTRGLGEEPKGNTARPHTSSPWSPSRSRSAVQARVLSTPTTPSPPCQRARARRGRIRASTWNSYHATRLLGEAGSSPKERTHLALESSTSEATLAALRTRPHSRGQQRQSPLHLVHPAQ